jgi:tetratricopeptide (TPR) repeat protein
MRHRKPALPPSTIPALSAARASRAAAAALAAFAIASCAPAAQGPARNPRLDTLFAELAVAPNAGDAAPIEQRIWAIWSESGSPTVDILLERAQAAEAGGDLPRAQRFLDSAADILPAYAEIYDRRAVVRLHANDPAGAIKDIEATLAREPRHFGALAALGMIYENMGQNRAALKAYEDALEIDPHLEDAAQGVKRLKQQVEGRET